jgi:hypothetical protein
MRQDKPILRCVGWLLTHLLGLVCILWGVHIHIVGHYPLYRANREITGEQAIGCSWFLIGVGVWALAQWGALFENRWWLKWPGYLIAGVMVLYGLRLSFR